MSHVWNREIFVETGIHMSLARKILLLFSGLMWTSGLLERQAIPTPVHIAHAAPRQTRRGYVDGSESQFFFKVP